MSDLVCECSSFEVDIDYKLGGEKNVSIIKYGNR